MKAKPMPAKTVQIKLKCKSNTPDCIGYPGEVIAVSPERAEMLISKRAAVAVTDAPPAAASKTAKAKTDDSPTPAGNDGADKTTETTPTKTRRGNPGKRRKKTDAATDAATDATTPAKE